MDIVVDGKARHGELGAELQEELLAVVVMDGECDVASGLGYPGQDRVDLRVRIDDANLVKEFVHRSGYYTLPEAAMQIRVRAPSAGEGDEGQERDGQEG